MTIEPDTLPDAARGACSHAVHFYERDDDLADAVGIDLEFANHKAQNTDIYA